MTDVPKELELRLIHSDDQLSKLSLGNANYTPLKIFLKKVALDFHQYNLAKTYMLAEIDMQPAIPNILYFIFHERNEEKFNS